MTSTLAKTLFGAGLVALSATFGSVAAPAHPNQRPVQVVFVLDTTGSMAPLIEGAKRKIWSIATAILDENPNAEVQMGLVAYRDIGDDYVTRVFPLTKDIQGLYADLLALRAAGGGDWPESVNEALYLAVAQMGWSHGTDTDRIVFLVGDAPPHMDYPQDRKYSESLEIARKSTITVNAVQAGSARDTERVWRTVAQLGQGRYIPIAQDGGRMLVVDTPYDREIIELQIEINRTILPYGTKQKQGELKAKADAVHSAPAQAASDMAGYVNRAGKGREAVTGEGDLVADVGAGRRTLDSVREEELPDELRPLDAPSRAKRIEEQGTKRAELASRMEALVRKRDAYVAKRVAETGAPKDSFDEVVKDTLRAQMKK